MGKRDRSRRPARRAPYKEPKPLILVVCEGQITEPEYLEGFAKDCHNPRVNIEVRGGKGVPKTIVEFAKALKKAAEKRCRREGDENLKYDAVWCVFDIDQHPHIPDARQMARDNGIDLAVSNPCIELWLWLHFREQPGMQQRHDMQRMLKTCVAGYDKYANYSEYAAGYTDAVNRAKRLDEAANADNEPGRNPSTGVWRLTESIRTDFSASPSR